MTSEMLQQMNRFINTIVYVDYENISELQKQVMKDAPDMEFFRIIQAKLQESRLKVIDFIVYGNFEKDSFNQRLQTLLRGRGFQTRHVVNNPNSSRDVGITVDALRTLYKNPNISVFVLIPGGREFIPLLKTFRYENKISYVLSTKNGFNQAVAEYANVHEFIEDIFQLPNPKPQDELDELRLTTDPANLDQGQIKRAQEVSRYFYNSHIWRRSLEQAEPINLNGYIQVASRIVNRSANEILDDFKVAHLLEYVMIYQDLNRHVLYIKQGRRRNEF
ncbi:MAG TPA: NYN domain-containing protein [Bacillota bacterium]|nr:NYN domain-containing protein [Bacillota bacterium]